MALRRSNSAKALCCSNSIFCTSVSAALSCSFFLKSSNIFPTSSTCSFVVSVSPFAAAALSRLAVVNSAVNAFCNFNFAVSAFITSALKRASSSKSSLVLLDNEFSKVFASALSLDTAISFCANSSDIRPASSKAFIRSSVLTFSLSAAFSLNSAISRSAFALSIIKSLAALSAAALWSATLAALLASFITSLPNSLTDSTADINPLATSALAFTIFFLESSTYFCTSTSSFFKAFASVSSPVNSFQATRIFKILACIFPVSKPKVPDNLSRTCFFINS